MRPSKLRFGAMGVACAMVVGMATAGVQECPLAGDAYSNPPDQLGHGVDGIVGATSDSNAPFFVAESVDIAASGDVTGVCWWGFYIDFNVLADCGVGTPGDGGNTFIINYYNDDAGGALPGSLRAGPFAVGDGTPTQTGLTISAAGLIIIEWIYTASHPAVPVTAGEKLWVEIFNGTTAVCLWLWETAPTVAEGGAGDGMSAQDLDNDGVYEPGEERDFDLGVSLSLVPPVTECFEIVSEEVNCHPDGETFTYDVEGINLCTGATMMFSFTASGGAVGEEMCFTVIVNDEKGGLCCTTQLCVTVPDCSQPAQPCDLDGDGIVGTGDLLMLLAAWGSDPGGPPDFDLDGNVGSADLLELLSNWG